jgi:hypothetical protein
VKLLLLTELIEFVNLLLPGVRQAFKVSDLGTEKKCSRQN